MSRMFLVAFFLFSFQCLVAQVGFTGAWKSFQADKWADTFYPGNGSNMQVLYGYNLGVDYWFRLKNKRIEFTPEISYEKYRDDFEDGTLEHRLLNFHFNTNFYLLDFKNDCNCPTWSKTGNFFTKGFFVQLSPGVSWLKNTFNSEATSEKNSGESAAFAAGAGVGLDLGLSEHLTVTPIFKYYYYPSVNWNGALAPVSTSTTIQQLYAGLKLGFRFKKERRF